MRRREKKKIICITHSHLPVVGLEPTQPQGCVCLDRSTQPTIYSSKQTPIPSSHPTNHLSIHQTHQSSQPFIHSLTQTNNHPTVRPSHPPIQITNHFIHSAIRHFIHSINQSIQTPNQPSSNPRTVHPSIQIKFSDLTKRVTQVKKVKVLI